MTDKVNAEVPSSFTGTITELVGEEGQTLTVGEIICKIETEETETEEAPKREEEQNTPSDTDANRQGKDQSNKARYSPAVLRLAGEHGIQLEEVEGTGAGGRITRKDIQKIIDSGMQQKSEAPAPAAVQTTQQALKQQQNKRRRQLCQPVILRFRLQASEKPSPPICIKAKQKFRTPGR